MTTFEYTGHCTCYCPVEFAALEAKNGREDALKHVELEKRTVDSILKIIKDNAWQDEVDLTQEGNIHLIRSEEEQIVIQKNLEAAASAGIDVSRFTFLSASECAKVPFPLTAAAAAPTQMALTWYFSQPAGRQ